MKTLLTLVLVTFLAGCQALELRNAGKTVTTTGVTYVVAGPLPAIANALTSMAYDEILPEEKELNEVHSTEQALAYAADKFLLYSLIGGIVFLLITNVLVPIITRQSGYNKAKRKYKYEEK